MIDVVIINKSENPLEIKQMMDCLLKGNNIENIYYIADRCSKEFIHELLNYSEPKLKIRNVNDNFIGRRSSSLRNIGYSFAKLDFDKINGVLFIDGDRFFIEGSTDLIEEDKINNIPIEDLRENTTDDYLLMFKDQILNLFYSACVYLPKEVCLKLENHSYKGLLWNEDIENIWGIEDIFMGNQLSILGINYSYNRGIKLNNTEMTGYKNINDNLNNMIYLMKAIVDYKKYLGLEI